MNEEYKKIYSDLKDNFKLTKRFDNSSVHSYLSQYFLNVMGYGNNGTYIHSENECSVIVEDELIIQLYNNYAKEQAINAITYKCEQDAIEWGILIHEDGMFLINSCIEYGNEAYKSDKIVFNIEYSRPADKKYLKYFTYDNLIQRRNTCYFRDIIIYRNSKYVGGKKSWYAYLSGLRRFFDYIIDHRIVKYEDDVYLNIRLTDLEKYILYVGKVKSEKSVKNLFFYIKDFMIKIGQSKEFDCGANVLCERLNHVTEKHSVENINIYNEKDKIKKLFDLMEKKQNALRNQVVLLLALSYGMERTALCELKWKSHFRINLHGSMEIKIQNNWYSTPPKLSEKLKLIKAENGGEYVLGSRYTKYKSQLPEESISTILVTIANYDKTDDFYKYLTIGHIRKCLFYYLLDKGYDLMSVMQMLDIDPNYLGNYIGNDYVRNNDEKMIRTINKLGKHPMDDFVNYICG